MRTSLAVFLKLPVLEQNVIPTMIALKLLLVSKATVLAPAQVCSAVRMLIVNQTTMQHGADVMLDIKKTS